MGAFNSCKFRLYQGFGGKEVPFYQLYTAGGIGTIRGFAYGAVGPKAIYTNNSGLFVSPSNDVIGGKCYCICKY